MHALKLRREREREREGERDMGGSLGDVSEEPVT